MSTNNSGHDGKLWEVRKVVAFAELNPPAHLYVHPYI
jgi:hypothetical protein